MGQLDEGPLTAAVAPEVVSPGIGLFDLFKVSVGAGITVWAITKWLNGRKG